MRAVRDYVPQTRFSDPGEHRGLFDELPADLRQLTSVVRNLIVHYRSGVQLSPERLEEINNCYVERILAVDQQRFRMPLADRRPVDQRVAGCCRDFTLLTVSALRHRGIPARSRIGFAGYLIPEWNVDHVMAEYWDGSRWVGVDAQLDPTVDRGFDSHDVPLARHGFQSAAQVWQGYRKGDLDPDTYGVAPDLPFAGPLFIYSYVIYEVAHRNGAELLLWDTWDGMEAESLEDVSLADELSELLLAADAGDQAAENQLSQRFERDPRLHAGSQVSCLSPTGQSVTVSR